MTRAPETGGAHDTEGGPGARRFGVAIEPAGCERHGGAGPVLRYDPAAGNSPFGFGWVLDVPAVVRTGVAGPPAYTDADVLRLSDVDVSALGGTVRRLRAGDGGEYWRSTAPDGAVHDFGRTPASRVSDPASGRVHAWLLDETSHPDGGVTAYEYAAEDTAGIGLDAVWDAHGPAGPCAGRYLKRIRRGGPEACQVVFDYGDHDPGAPAPEPSRPWPVRSDAYTSGRAGFEVRTRRRCRRVLVFHGESEPRLVRSLDLTHDDDPAGALLTAVTETGHRWDPHSGAHRSEPLPPLGFAYTAASPDTVARAAAPDAAAMLRTALDEQHRRGIGVRRAPELAFTADMTGDGIDDDVRVGADEVRYRPGLGGGRFGDWVVMGGAPRFDHPDRFDPSRIRAADIDGTGTTDLIYITPAEVRYWRNLAGNRFGATRRLEAPVTIHDPGKAAVADVLGTGTACLVWSSTPPRGTTRIRYLDLSREVSAEPGSARPGHRARVLCRVVNNLGAEARIRYGDGGEAEVHDRVTGLAVSGPAAWPALARMLRPARSTEPERLDARVERDSLGRVVAVWGPRDPEHLPGTVVTYGDAWAAGLGPAWVATATRTVPGDPAAPWRHTRAYLDGYGRVVRTKTQIEPGRAWTPGIDGRPVEIDTGRDPRWLGTGTVHDHRGRPTREYGPYVCATDEYEDEETLAALGVACAER